jgi:hypothetical protein
MPNSRELTVPAFHTALTMLGLAEALIKFQDPDDKEKFKAFIQKWVEADQVRENDPRQFLQLFGEGFALFCSLPNEIRETTDNERNLFKTPIIQALAVAGVVANTAKIRVQFTENGPVFS